MDSIAAPVKDIQFPTITVCQDENKPPDNWALIELIFNNLAFECEVSTYYGLPSCNDTTKIRNDFKFFIEEVSSMIRGLMTHPEFQDYSLSVWSSDVGKLVEKVALSLTNGELNIADFSKLANEYFGVKSDLEPILRAIVNETEDDYWSFYSYYATQEPPINCTSKHCQEYLDSAWSIVQTLSEVTSIQPNLPMGSFVARFIPHLFKEFCEECEPKLSFDIPTYSTSDTSQANCTIEMEEKLLHVIFASLSNHLGFDNLISLYDIPPILSTTKEMSYGGVKKSQSFSYTWCQNNIAVEDSEVCYLAWKHYSEMPKPNGK